MKKRRRSVKYVDPKKERVPYIWSRIDAYSLKSAQSAKLNQKLSKRKRRFNFANGEFSTEEIPACNKTILKVNNNNTSVNRYKHLMNEEDLIF